jgi:hypothetical protein
MKSWKTLVGMLAATLLLVACAEDDPAGNADTGPEQDSGWDADAQAPEDMGNDTEDMGQDARDGGEDMGGEDMNTGDPTTIRGVRNTEAVKNLEPGEQTAETFSVTDVVVSSLKPANADRFTGLYIQDKAGAAERSGIFTTVNRQGLVEPRSRGDVLTVSGSIKNDGGELRFAQPTLSQVETVDAPTPQVVDASALGSDTFEGVLVTIENQTVATWDPSNNDGSADFESGISLGSELYDFAAEYPDVASGDEFSSVTGILGVVDGERRLLPREEGDLVPSSTGSGGGG